MLEEVRQIEILRLTAKVRSPNQKNLKFFLPFIELISSILNSEPVVPGVAFVNCSPRKFP